MSAKRLKDLERIVELYQNGALIEYHQFDPKGKKPRRMHVGFRYDAMSDDDYFELRDLESKYKIKENPNWRGDAMQSERGRVAVKNMNQGEFVCPK